MIHSAKSVIGSLLCLIVLSGCGGGGGSGSGAVANVPPVAEAGTDQSVYSGVTVTLAGRGTDSDGSIASYRWTQASGPAVTLSGSTQPNATFTSPDVDGSVDLEFTLTVTDNAGASASDRVIVTVSERLEVVFSKQPAAISKDAFAVFDFAAADASRYECKLDAEDYAACDSPFVAFPVDPGTHIFSVRASSSNSYTDEPTSIEWTVSSIFGDAADPALDSDLAQSNQQPARVDPNSWRGIFRINCDFAHSDYDDPIVFPGQDKAAHLHRFYGNTLLDENTDLTSLFTEGESSCQGNELNRSAYWMPALLAPSYNQATGQRLVDANGEPAWTVVPAVVGDNDVAHEIFYYSAGVDDLNSIEPIPLGLRMIAGNHMAGPGNEQDTAIVRWHCQSWESSDATNPRWSTSIPECLAPDRVRMDIFFPSCWNGTDLDSADHKSHLTYPVSTSTFPNGTSCPASHPVPIIRVSFHYAFGVTPDVYDPVTETSKGWRLASDSYDPTDSTPGGISLHGDWFNAWHPEALQAVLDECIRKELDCHDGNYGNGSRLSGTRPGTGEEPEIRNGGYSYD